MFSILYDLRISKLNDYFFKFSRVYISRTRSEFFYLRRHNWDLHQFRGRSDSISLRSLSMCSAHCFKNQLLRKHFCGPSFGRGRTFCKEFRRIAWKTLEKNCFESKVNPPANRCRSIEMRFLTSAKRSQMHIHLTTLLDWCQTCVLVWNWIFDRIVYWCSEVFFKVCISDALNMMHFPDDA